jgi:hypothetical protein
MESVTAKRRIKVATRDHAVISMVHLRLHSWAIFWVCFILFLLGVAAFIVAGITRPNVESEWKVTRLKGPFEY